MRLLIIPLCLFLTQATKTFASIEYKLGDQTQKIYEAGGTVTLLSSNNQIIDSVPLNQYQLSFARLNQVPKQYQGPDALIRISTEIEKAARENSPEITPLEEIQKHLIQINETLKAALTPSSPIQWTQKELTIYRNSFFEVSVHANKAYRKTHKIGETISSYEDTTTRMLGPRCDEGFQWTPSVLQDFSGDTVRLLEELKSPRGFWLGAIVTQGPGLKNPAYSMRILNPLGKYELLSYLEHAPFPPETHNFLCELLLL